jgi:hypothetical protein
LEKEKTGGKKKKERGSLKLRLREISPLNKKGYWG